MDEITRYALANDGWSEHSYSMRPETTGEYVLHSDHLAATAQLRERVKELEAMLSTSLEQFESRMGDWENAEFHAWFNEAKKLVPPNWK